MRLKSPPIPRHRDKDSPRCLGRRQTDDTADDFVDDFADRRRTEAQAEEKGLYVLD